MRVKNLPWGRCSKAIRNGCKNPCSHYLAHHIPRWGHCWCHCEPVERPPEFKSWAAYNRMLTFRLTVEEAPMRVKQRYDNKAHQWIQLGRVPLSNPHDHSNEKEFANCR